MAASSKNAEDITRETEKNVAQLTLDDGSRDDKLVDVKWAYHVTNFPAIGTNEPKLSKLRWSIADDPAYDGALFGFPCVYFTTTLWNGDLPTISMYPRDFEPNTKYWRVEIPLEHFKEYEILFCNQYEKEGTGVKQVLLVLAEKSRAEDLKNSLSLNKEKPEAYLTKIEKDQEIIWRSTEFDRKANKITFVNFAILGDFDIPKTRKWSAVDHYKTEMTGASDRAKATEDLIKLMIKQKAQFK